MTSINKELNILHDKKSQCLSIITNIKVSRYLEIIAEAYKNDGAIDGQRKAQTSKSALRIRKQMTSDFIDGGVLPPVVIGITDPDLDDETTFTSQQNLIDALDEFHNELSIIDGMQRTTAMIEAVAIDSSDKILNREIRIEVWVAQSITKLIYRMLVLNTGQLPWSLRRQIEVVMQPIKKEIVSSISNLKMMNANEGGRRTTPGEFQADKILESFLIYGTRSQKVDSRDLISDEFVKLDFIDSASKTEILTDFITILSLIVDLDIVLSKIKSDNSKARFSKGIDLFTSQPALAGFICALAIKIYGRPGTDYETKRQQKNFDRITGNFKSLIEVLELKNEAQLSEFMRFETLNTVLGSLSSPNTKIGDIERSYFKDSFTVLIDEDFNIDNMDVCWRA
ncbi:hypothetical protein GRW77_14605 [Escherichia coli]|jgi:hypothetical protein|uniref:hypothetical protein n=1 Tax=Enterobacter cloacae complex TaxID=354276 RepID=UPI0007981DD1|nr:MULTISPECIES: hypothetical protein [Enterobacter cloacae complex]MXG72554.1 hypothetical protein [Escherichia coli]HDS5129598.1 hypothetical protein [Enterobacter hormaechei subsp. xiangfangensis]HED4180732.1 hypothetical protein [Enterobacter mori]MCK7083240.1 hypothetical protein [Enterobacter kobei]MXH03526.1 hypothetical protein [Escherichia coli]